MVVRITHIIKRVYYKIVKTSSQESDLKRKKVFEPVFIQKIRVWSPVKEITKKVTRIRGNIYRRNIRCL